MPWEPDPNGNLVFVPDHGGGSTGSPYRESEGGLVFNQADGQYYIQTPYGTRTATPDEIAAAFAPGGSGGGGPSGTSLLNAQIDRERLAEDRRQFDRDFDYQQRYDYDKLEQDRLQEQANIAYLQDKLRIETEAGQRSDALETQRLIQDHQANQQRIAFEQQSLAQQIRQREQDNAFREREFQAGEQERAAQRGERQVEQRRGLARDIAGFAADPGDRSKLAAYLAASGGPDALTRAIGGDQSFITDESLQPLAMGLDALGQVGQPSGVQRALTGGGAQEPGQDLPWYQPGMSALGPEAQQAIRSTWLGNANQAANEQGLTLDQFYAAGSPGVSQSGPAAGTRINWTDWAQQPVPGERQSLQMAEHGGLQEGAFIAGDDSEGKENREVVIPLAEGVALVVPEDKVSGVTKQLRKMQTGGLFGAGLQDTTKARSFLEETLRRAMAGGPFQKTPTPVQVSSQLTNPLLQQYASGLAATGAGVDRRSFLNEALRLAPTLLQQGIIGRGR